MLLMSDRLRLPNLEAAIRRLPQGAAVIFRDYDLPDRWARAFALATLCRERRVRFLVAGDIELALAARAEGLHVAESRMSAVPAFRRRRREALITVACHSAGAIRRAASLGASAAILSPVFATQSHADAPWLGPFRFQALAQASALPVYALGGIDALAAKRLPPGATGVAAIGALRP